MTRVEAIVTYLERPLPAVMGPMAIPPAASLTIDRPVPVPLDVYRRLYDEIGEQHAWVSRRGLSDLELARLIQAPEVTVSVASLAGRPVGFTEVVSRAHQNAELTFLGVRPAFIGLGVGRRLLGDAMALAVAKGARRIELQTSSLDHPHALRLYTRFGFQPVRRHSVDIHLPADMPLPRSQARRLRREPA